MIKLIATDLGGSLLNDNKHIPDNLYYVLKKLAEAGWPFVTENGVQRLKDKYPLRGGDNNKNGVTNTINDYIIEKTKQL